jgi:alkylation response protein AidB-like acyl-CoA dehydrogenase
VADNGTTAAEDREELRATIRRFLQKCASETEVRRLMEDEVGFSSPVWQQMASQLGLQGLIIPEEYGGSGFGFEELCVVFEEMGRVLLPSPFLATVGLAASAVLSVGDEAAMRRYLPGIAAGETIATVAINEADSGWDGTAARTRAEFARHEWTLSGSKRYVLDACAASLLLVVARTSDGVALFAVEKDAPGLSVTPYKTMDLTRRLAELTFVDTPAALIGSSAGAGAKIEEALLRGAVALAAEQVGGSQRVLEMAVEYAKTRYQFGRPIGSFQAIKHKCADMYMEIELAKAAVGAAGRAAAENSVEFSTLARAAKSFCSEAFYQVAATNIQVHGGMGFTWEHPAHLYFKRATSGEFLLGSGRDHRRRIAVGLGLNPL